MNGAAPTSRLMQSLRSGFQQQGSFGLTATPVVDDSLQVLDQVLTEVEQARPTSPPVTPVLTAVEPTSPSSTFTPTPPSPLTDAVMVSTPAAPLPPEPLPTEASPVLASEPIVAPAESTPVEVPSVTPPGPLSADSPTATVNPYDPSAQVVPQVIAQATDTLNPAYASAGRPTAKETLASAPVIEAAAGVQVVEEEKNPEIPVEVESYLQRAENHADQLPQEIVIADVAQAPLASHYAKQPVIVLPITPEVEAAGAKKGPAQSVRWLVEFSRKIMKMFAGKVIYRDA